MKNRASFLFQGRLRQMANPVVNGPIDYRFHGQPAIKDAIEALGVPHTEVDLILVAGAPVDFSYRLKPGDCVEVCPFGYDTVSFPRHSLSPALANSVAFILDVHLGKLARRLRMLGFDCHYRNDYSDPQIIELALQEGLIILTRDRGILKHACVSQGYLVGSQQVEAQVEEVLQRYRLHGHVQALKRCPVCNGLLVKVSKEQIRHLLQPKTARYYQDFLQCSGCQRLYWQGSHYGRIERWIQQLVGRGQP